MRISLKVIWIVQNRINEDQKCACRLLWRTLTIGEARGLLPRCAKSCVQVLVYITVLDIEKQHGSISPYRA